MLRLQGKVLEVFSMQFVLMGWFGWVSELAIAGLGKGVRCGFGYCPVRYLSAKEGERLRTPCRFRIRLEFRFLKKIECANLVSDSLYMSFTI